MGSVLQHLHTDWIVDAIPPFGHRQLVLVMPQMDRSLQLTIEEAVGIVVLDRTQVLVAGMVVAVAVAVELAGFVALHPMGQVVPLLVVVAVVDIQPSHPLAGLDTAA